MRFARRSRIGNENRESRIENRCIGRSMSTFAVFQIPLSICMGTSYGLQFPRDVGVYMGCGAGGAARGVACAWGVASARRYYVALYVGLGTSARGGHTPCTSTHKQIGIGIWNGGRGGARVYTTEALKCMTQPRQHVHVHAHVCRPAASVWPALGSAPEKKFTREGR